MGFVGSLSSLGGDNVYGSIYAMSVLNKDTLPDERPRTDNVNAYTVRMKFRRKDFADMIERVLAGRVAYLKQKVKSVQYPKARPRSPKKINILLTLHHGFQTILARLEIITTLPLP